MVNLLECIFSSDGSITEPEVQSTKIVVCTTLVVFTRLREFKYIVRSR